MWRSKLERNTFALFALLLVFSAVASRGNQPPVKSPTNSPTPALPTRKAVVAMPLLRAFSPKGSRRDVLHQIEHILGKTDGVSGGVSPVDGRYRNFSYRLDDTTSVDALFLNETLVSLVASKSIPRPNRYTDMTTEYLYVEPSQRSQTPKGVKTTHMPPPPSNWSL
jgi:hypothetical protein